MPLNGKWVDLVLRAVLGAVLLVSAAYKLKDRRDYEMAVFVASGYLRKFYKQISAVGLTLELAIGLALCAGLYPAITASASVVLMLIFDAALISLRLSGYEGGCGCFGSRSAAGITIWHFVRNALLSIAAGWLLLLRAR
jgi:hypothetical protein